MIMPTGDAHDTDRFKQISTASALQADARSVEGTGSTATSSVVRVPPTYYSMHACARSNQCCQVAAHLGCCMHCSRHQVSYTGRIILRKEGGMELC